MLSELSIEHDFYGHLHQLSGYGMEVCLKIEGLGKLAYQGLQFLSF